LKKSFRTRAAVVLGLWGFAYPNCHFQRSRANFTFLTKRSRSSLFTKGSSPNTIHHHENSALSAVFISGNDFERPMTESPARIGCHGSFFPPLATQFT
jgi:hypothetical protein